MMAAVGNSTATALLLCALFVGCSRSDRPELAPVTGTVTIDGQPVFEGLIAFESTGLRPASAEIIDGKIANATTYEQGDGVPVGQHKVAVWAYDPATAAQRAKPRPGYMPVADYLPKRYGDPEKSGLTASISADNDNVLKFELTSDPK